MSLKIKNLSHIYMKDTPYEKKALKNINLEITQGEFVGIIGKSGSGKSTLAQHIGAILKPMEGKVLIDNIETTSKQFIHLKSKVGSVFQYPEKQLFAETVYKDIVFGIERELISKEEQLFRVKKIAKMLGINEDIMEKSPFELSGGQKRSVAIAGVLIMEPSILVLDEPTSGLDPSGRCNIMEMLKQLNQEGKTIIVVSHNIDEITNYSNRILVMNNGRIDMDGSKEDIFKEEKLLNEKGIYISDVTRIMKNLKKIFPQIKDSVFSVEEAKHEILKLISKQ